MQHFMHVQYLNTLISPEEFTLYPQVISLKRHLGAFNSLKTEDAESMQS